MRLEGRLKRLAVDERRGTTPNLPKQSEGAFYRIISQI